MRSYITLLFMTLSLSLHAQVKQDVKDAYDSFRYDKVISLSSGECDSEVIEYRLNSLKALGKYSQFINELSAIVAVDSTNVGYLINLADVYRMIGNNRSAATYYQKASDLIPDNNYFKIQNIRSLIAAEDNEKAISACHNYLSNDSITSLGYKYLGMAYENCNDLMSAFASYNIAYRKDSLDFQVVYRLANIFNDNKQFKDAISITEKYRESDTTNIDVNRQNALAYCLMSDYETAIKRYESLKQAGDRSVSTLYYLGVAYYGDNWYYGAYDNFKLAFDKNPKDVNVLYYLANSAVRTSWKKDGVEYMQKALEIAIPSDSTMVWLYKGLQNCSSYAGNFEVKLEAMKKLYSLTNDYELLYSIGDTYFALKDYNRALTNFEKYISLLPESAKKIPENPENDRMTKYQLAKRRIDKIKTENFFKSDSKVK